MAKLQPEPWRVKVVEPIRRIGPAQRDECLRRAGYNVFGIPCTSTPPPSRRHQAAVLRHFTARFELL